MNELDKINNKRILYLRNIAHWKKVIRFCGDSAVHLRGLREAEFELDKLNHQCEQLKLLECA